MTEFTGLDLEMAFEQHYDEVLEVLEELFVFIFTELKTRFSKEIATVRKQFPWKNSRFQKMAKWSNYTLKKVLPC